MKRPATATDLFEAQRMSGVQDLAPLAARMRPRTIEEFVGQEDIVGPDTLLRRAIEEGKVGSLILYGPPGIGKTTLADIVARKMDAQVDVVSAVTAGVKDLRAIIDAARDRLKFYPPSSGTTGLPARGGEAGARHSLGEGGLAPAGVAGRSSTTSLPLGLHRKRTVLIVDEIHRFHTGQQDVLLPHVENGTLTLIGITTENPYFEVVKALVSRSQVYQLSPLSEEHVRLILTRALTDVERGLGRQHLRLDPDAVAHLARMSGGDARIALNALELAATAKPAGAAMTLADIEEAIQARAFKYDATGDEHYDTISAFIKSMRGSDPDAALFWLHKMLAAGEDPEFIARRMIIFASEDVGNADPQALVVTTAAATALEWVGLPEAEYALSHAAIYLAASPKSDAVKRAMRAVKSDLHAHGQLRVPPHLKNAPIPEMKRHPSTGSGQAAPSVGYQDPHEGAGHVVEQQYLPDQLRDRFYYEPTGQGEEETIARRLEKLRRIVRKKRAKHA